MTTTNQARCIDTSVFLPLFSRVAVVLLLAWGGPSFAQSAADPPMEARSTPGAGDADQGVLVGPSSVPGQIQSNEETRSTTPGPALPRIPLRKRLERDYGLTLGADYQALYQYATEGPEDDAAGGVFRFYGHWTPFNRDAAGAGALVFKAENRHKLGTPIAPQALGPTDGYAGLTAATFSEAGSLLTNLYWTQAFADNRFAFNAGLVDVTDYLDVYALVNVWTDFNNLAFSTNPTIPSPSQGLGAAAHWMFTPNYYVVGGVADANGDPHHPADMFETLGEGELFKHLELGWIGSWDQRFSDNAHITAWQVDAREQAGVDSGWGVTLSWSRTLKQRWTPFVRAGYSEGGGALVERSVSAGVGYQLNARNDYIGFGANWARPPSAAGVDSRTDQYTFEAYYRIQVLPQVQIVPDVQFIVNPGLDPSLDNLWVLGVRVRATF